MTTTLIATYSNGVFKPQTPVDLPENSQVELTLNSDVGASQLPSGSPDAIRAFLKMCNESPLHTGVGWQGRDELYDRD